jgi:hypothetical protein
MRGLSWTSGEVADYGPVQEASTDVDGYTLNMVRFLEDIDGAPMLRGLPDDRCPCPHWGYVVKGRKVFTFADHVEEYVAGEAFYVGPGHTPAADAGTEIVLFSPAEELKATADALRQGTAAQLPG